MLVKIILVFLAAMVLIGMIGKAMFPGTVRRLTGVRRCARCGKPQIGSAPCKCKKG